MSAIGAPAVPGLVIRPYAGPGDVPIVVRVVNAEYAADAIEERVTEESERTWLAHPSDQFDPARDVVIAELDGRPVGLGFLTWAETRDGRYREYRTSGYVVPEARRLGVGRALLADNERRARELAAGHPADREPILFGFAAEGRPGEALLRAAGYAPVRWFFDMVRPHLDAVEVPPMPDGLEVRPIGRDDYPALWRANREAFRDHWGGSDESDAAMRRFLEQPALDPALMLVAFDGDEIAGGVINAIHPEENAELGLERGWLDNVFTRRPWRRRGLARALITRSLVLLRERGMTSAALGVDAENPTGALGLYEREGFEVHMRYAAFRRPLERAS